MTRENRRAIKAAEKLRKICARDLQRLGALREKYDDLRHAGEGAPLARQLFERLQQKELMASGDLVWVEQMIEQLRDDRPVAPAPAPADADNAQRPALKLI
jgi:hypothetical protein